jgi:nitrate/nitrite-specific signal transduction histidine kinase
VNERISVSLAPGILIGGIIFIALLAAGLTFFFVRSSYQQRLRKILFPEGNKSFPAYGDIFGQVERTLKHLEEEQKRSTLELVRLRQNLDGLLSISEATVRTISLDKIYQRILDTLIEVTGFMGASIHLLNGTGDYANVVAQRGWETPEMVKELSVFSMKAPILQEVAETLAPAYTLDMQVDSRWQPESGIKAGFHSVIMVPLLAGSKLVGIYGIGTREIYVPSETELRWLATIGRQLGVVIDHIQISEQMRDLAILQERERLSQEIHDNLSQLIGALRVQAEAARLSLEEGDFKRAQDGLERIEQTAGEAHANVREEMIGLRTMSIPSKSLIPTLVEYLRRYQEQWNIKTVLESQDGNKPLPISNQAEIQLLRIVQEALTNVRRHASALQVVVRVGELNHSLYVEIEDNGRGFDTEHAFENRLGIRIMRERAASLGGSLIITPGSEAGTVVRVEVPKLL